MATFRLKLEGEPRRISLKSFVQATNSSFKIVNELDSAISGGGGLLEWVVTDLKLDGLVIEAESYSRVEGRDTGLEVVRAFVNGLGQIEREGTTPPYLSEAGLGHARRLIKLIGQNGTQGLQVSNLEETVDLTARASANVEQLLQVRRESVGSVEGKLETNSAHGRAHKFLLYQSRTNKAVACSIGLELIDQARAAIGHRASVAGIVQYNLKSEPVRVVVKRIRVLRGAAELPSISDLTGSDPAFTGEMGSVEYLRSIRGA